MDGRLDSARNATIAAKGARDEAAMFKEEAARAQDASDDALEDAMKIQKEMRAILDICKNKQDFMKQQEKEMTQKEEAADGDKRAQLEAAAKEKKEAAKKDAEMEAKKDEAKKDADDEKANPVKKATKEKKEEKKEAKKDEEAAAPAPKKDDGKLAALQEQLAA